MIERDKSHKKEKKHLSKVFSNWGTIHYVEPFFTPQYPQYPKSWSQLGLQELMPLRQRLLMLIMEMQEDPAQTYVWIMSFVQGVEC